MSEIVDALESVERAVNGVERAVKAKWSSASYVYWGLISLYLFMVLPGQLWHAKWRYALAYNLSSDKIIINDHPHDCAFLAAPLGEKYCHYERTVSTTRWATSPADINGLYAAGQPIVSYDEGKTWSTFTPNPNVKVPLYSTVEAVYISWEKKDD